MTRKLQITVIGILLVLTLFADSHSREKRKGVRAQLADIQKETGLTIAEFGGRIQTVDFANRSFSGGLLPPPVRYATLGIVSQDGAEIAFALPEVNPGLGIARSDGTMIAAYREYVEPEGFCWSADRSKLVFSAQLAGHTRRDRALFILDLATGATQQINPPGPVTAQCWSSSGQQVVYHCPSGICVYDVLSKVSTGIGKGTEPTWSPNGEWIAFCEDVGADTYYAVRPTGDGRKLLFKAKDPHSALLWSPDSRIVAYRALTRSYSLLDPTIHYRIHVRRLDDNADDWVGVVNGGDRFVWIQPERARH